MFDHLRVLAWFDGKPGHESQVRGLLACLPEGAQIHEIHLPAEIREGAERKLGVWALGSKHLHMKPPKGLLAELLGEEWTAIDRFGPQLSIAAGTRGGLYSFCTARLQWCPTVQAMTHGTLKYAFTLNVVPAHDRPPQATNIVVTRTAPNPYLPAVARKAAETFFADKHIDPEGRYWSLILGGPPAGAGEEVVDVEGIVAECKRLLRTIDEHDVQLLVSSSRRTPDALADTLLPVMRANPRVAWCQDFRADDSRTAGALLGAASQAFLTPDSISMVSEALWAGRGVTLIPLQRDAHSQPVIPGGKHQRFLDNLLQEGFVRWFTTEWEPPLTRIDLVYRHNDFLAIQTALRELVRDVPPI